MSAEVQCCGYGCTLDRHAHACRYNELESTFQHANMYRRSLEHTGISCRRMKLNEMLAMELWDLCPLSQHLASQAALHNI